MIILEAPIPMKIIPQGGGLTLRFIANVPFCRRLRPNRMFRPDVQSGLFHREVLAMFLSRYLTHKKTLIIVLSLNAFLGIAAI